MTIVREMSRLSKLARTLDMEYAKGINRRTLKAKEIARSLEKLKGDLIEADVPGLISEASALFGSKRQLAMALEINYQFLVDCSNGKKDLPYSWLVTLSDVVTKRLIELEKIKTKIK